MACLGEGSIPSLPIVENISWKQLFGHSIFVNVDEILFLTNFEPRVNVINARRHISIGKLKVRFESFQPDFTASKPSGILTVGKHFVKVFLTPEAHRNSPLYTSTYGNVVLNGNNYKSVVRQFLKNVKQKRQPLGFNDFSVEYAN